MRLSMHSALSAVVLAAVSSAFPLASPARSQPDRAAPLDATPFFFALSVRDVEASASWYRHVFGFEPTRAVDLDERGIRIRLLRLDDALLELVELPNARSPEEIDQTISRRHEILGLFKLGFEVADLDDALARFEALGIPTRGEPVTEPDGTLRSVQVEDPDGNIVQLFERLD